MTSLVGALPVDDRTEAAFVSSEIFRHPAFGENHPLAIPRVGLVMELSAMLGWLDPDGYEESPRASERQLARFHDRDYIAAVRQADADGHAGPELRQRYNLGTRENPIFPGMFERVTTACGGSIRAAELAVDGRVAFNPAGGTHHGLRDRAHGFCYFNDPVMSILTLLERGMQRVFYLDIDAHHGDGVERAFAEDERVFTVSIHETGRWPFTGEIDDRAGGAARNLPVPPGLNDSEFDYLMMNAVLPLADTFQPDAVVVTCGADGLDGDPLSKMALSNGALWRAVLQAVALTRHAVVLGGGGYNPWTLARCWTGLWGMLNGFAVPDRLPPDAEGLLCSLSCDLVDEDDYRPEWFAELKDPPNDGLVRNDIWELPRQVLAP